jgi:hypothetical protein
MLSPRPAPHVVNDLTTGGATAAASAETVKTLKTMVDALNATVAALQPGATAPTILTAPAINGTPQVGVAGTYTAGTYAGSAATLSRQWTRDGAAISGATNATYTPVSGDATHLLRVVEMATNASGNSGPNTSSGATVTAAVVVAPTISAAPAIVGTPQVGAASSYTPGTYGGSAATLTRQWTLDGVAISGATGPTYTPVSGDATHLLRVVETATNSAGNSGPNASASATVTAATGDTRPRYGYGTATAGVSSPAALLASMTPLAGSSNGGIAGTFTSAPPTGQYVWAAFVASASAGGVNFSVTLGPGGWQGASSPGPNFDDDGSSPNTSSVTYSDGTTNWRFFRTSFANAADSWTTS